MALSTQVGSKTFGLTFEHILLCLNIVSRVPFKDNPLYRRKILGCVICFCLWPFVLDVITARIKAQRWSNIKILSLIQHTFPRQSRLLNLDKPDPIPPIP